MVGSSDGDRSGGLGAHGPSLSFLLFLLVGVFMFSSAIVLTQEVVVNKDKKMSEDNERN